MGPYEFIAFVSPRVPVPNVVDCEYNMAGETILALMAFEAIEDKCEEKAEDR